MNVTVAHTEEGSIWEVDGLRPEGKAGALVRRWRATWTTTNAGPRPGSSRHFQGTAGCR